MTTIAVSAVDPDHCVCIGGSKRDAVLNPLCVPQSGHFNLIARPVEHSSCQGSEVEHELGVSVAGIIIQGVETELVFNANSCVDDLRWRKLRML